MKISPSTSPSRAGFALLMVLVITTASIMILLTDMSRTRSVAIMNNSMNNYNTCCNAAEAAVEKAYARMAYDFQSFGVAGVSNNISIYQNGIPTAAENPFWSKFQFSDANGNVGKTYVSYVYSYTGQLPSAYAGLYTANAPVYRIISNVQNTNSNNNSIGTAQEDILLALVPLTTWAIFYNGLLEFTQCATMIVNGRVQANGAIYVGTTASLTFNSGVSCTSTLTAPFVDGLSSGWTPGTSSTWNTTFNGSPGYTTNVASVTVSLNMTNSHFLIDIPTNGESPTSATGIQRLYNQAQMVLLVTNASASVSTNLTVQLTIQNSVNGLVPGNDPSPVVLTYSNATPALLSSNLPFLSLTNVAYDQRETDTNLFTQIDVGKLASWTSTNATVQGKLPASSGIYPTIMYVADRRPRTSTQLPAVRLVNGAQLPANGSVNPAGFTVATPNPIYVWGNYNIQTSAGSASGTNTYEVPAALLADSLTVLSGHWTDSSSYTAYAQQSSFTASNDTINAAIVVGTVPSADTSATNFSGGVHNLPRLLENWGSANLYLNTSILRLWDSNMATNQFRNPYGFSPSPVNPYYNPPTRHYSFDQNFLNPAMVPPGIPVALVPIRFAWGVPPPNTTTYTPAHN